MTIFISYVSRNQMVNPIKNPLNTIKPPFSYGNYMAYTVFFFNMAVEFGGNVKIYIASWFPYEIDSSQKHPKTMFCVWAASEWKQHMKKKAKDNLFIAILSEIPSWYLTLECGKC